MAMTQLCPPNASDLGHPMQPAAPKLRESCHACASSKIKCTKEKPACSRCAKRGLECKYLAAKRIRRRQDSRPQRTKGSDNLHASEETNHANEARNAVVSVRSNNCTTGDLITPPDSISSTAHSELGDCFLHNSPSFQERQPSSYDGLFPSLFLTPSTSDARSSSGLTTSGTETVNFEDCSTTPFPFSDVIDTSDTAAPAHPHPNGILSPQPSLFNEDLFSNMTGNLSLPPVENFVHSRSNTVVGGSQALSAAAHAQISPATYSSSSESCCLAKVLVLVRRLSPNASTACTHAERFESDRSRQPRAMEIAIAENKPTTESISNILQCSCAADPYILHILSLLTFKVMEWYAAAVSESDPIAGGSVRRDFISHEQWDSSVDSELVLRNSKKETSLALDDDNPSRQAAQLVLSELHRVQRLVNLLSQRLKAPAIRNHVGQIDTFESTQESMSSELLKSVPFSVMIFDQLEADLRGRLRAISREILGMLRRG